MSFLEEEVIGLSQIQTQIYNAKSVNKMTYKDIIEIFKLTITSLGTCLRRTALRYFWEPDFGGGEDFYISLTDDKHLLDDITMAAENLNCIRTVELQVLTYQVKEKRFARAREELMQIKCSEQAMKLMVSVLPPSRSWCNDFALRNDLAIGKSTDVENERIQACTTEKISSFSKNTKNLEYKSAFSF